MMPNGKSHKLYNYDDDLCMTTSHTTQILYKENIVRITPRKYTKYNYDAVIDNGRTKFADINPNKSTTEIERLLQTNSPNFFTT